MTPSDDIDEVVSSVRNFVSYNDNRRTPSRTLEDRLLLTPEQRVAEETVKAENAVLSAMPVYEGLADNVHLLKPVKPEDREDLEATIAELEAAVTAQSGEWEADEGEDFAGAAWAASAFEAPVEAVEETRDHPVVEVVVEPTADTMEEPSIPETIEDVVDTAVIETAVASQFMARMDEEALRALVVETVHQELSGELGERITRNVRKLVRREINRVLTSREMGQD